MLALVARRANREPLQYLLGTQEFCGREFRVTSAVLIPRPESVLLVREAIRRCGQNPAAIVVDVGTGSGCLAVSVASALPDARVLAIDASADALAVAQANMEQHGLDARIECMQGDLLAPLAECGFVSQIDVIVSNPCLLYTSQDAIHHRKHQGRHLCRVSSLLYGNSENRRYRRACRTVQEEVRQER